ncbi:MAG TPA: roadblock/LC7 domain-containing protein [Kiritimatiellia bacterium]|nr:roadblock/LC7 domain-containing protein [Kiritimatiellia bacterium]
MNTSIALTEEVSRQIDKILSELLERGEAEAVFLCDRGGNIISHRSVVAYSNEENISALAAGSFFATQEMARLLGESRFKSLLHQGEKTSIYMEGMPGDVLIIVVFSKDSNPGLVKLYVKHACKELEPLSLALLEPSGAGHAMKLNLEIDENSQPFTSQAGHE